MGIKVRKVALILLSGSILLSGTACNLRRRKRVNANKFIKQAYQETHVTEWTGPVPEGMEIQYVCVRKQRVNDRSELSDERYEYDDHGHQTSYMDVWANGSYRVEVDYNSDGTVSATRIRHEGSQPGRPSPDSDGFLHMMKMAVSFVRKQRKHVIKRTSRLPLSSCTMRKDV